MSALILKIIALISMTLDHVGHYVPYGSYMRIAGRLAFPIYAFLLANGFAHTSNRGRYAFRLAIFALISQLPFSMAFKAGFIDGTMSLKPLLWEYVHHGSVMTSLLIAFLCLWLLEANKEQPLGRWLSRIFVLWVLVLYELDVIHSDYGPRCLLMVLCFYYFREKPVWMVLSITLITALLSYDQQIMIFVNGIPETFPKPSSWTLKQLVSLVSLVPILLYNGKKGWSPETQPWKKLWQVGFYAYYPLHLVVLFFLFRF